MDINEKLKELLSEDTDLLVDITRSLNAWHGGWDFVDTYDLEDLCSMYENGYEVVRAVIWGDVENVYDNVRFDGYGNLESVTEYDVIDDCLADIDSIIDDFLNTPQVLREFLDNSDISEILDGISEDEDEE